MDSSLLLRYEHTVTQDKNNTDIIYLYVAAKNILGTTESSIYSFVYQTASLHRTKS